LNAVDPAVAGTQVIVVFGAAELLVTKWLRVRQVSDPAGERAFSTRTQIMVSPAGGKSKLRDRTFDLISRLGSSFPQRQLTPNSIDKPGEWQGSCIEPLPLLDRPAVVDFCELFGRGSLTLIDERRMLVELLQGRVDRELYCVAYSPL